jgi:hypothetical protein
MSWLKKLNIFSKIKNKLKNKNEISIDSKDIKLAYAKAFKVSSQINRWIFKGDFTCISLGENCNSSWYLKETGNKNSSFPFDWLFTSPDIIYDILENDFETFLDLNLVYKKRDGKSGGHKKYHDSLFNHKNPLLPENFQYYQRCTFRFREVMLEKQNVVFLINVINEPEKRVGWYLGFNSVFEAPTNQSLTDFDRLYELIKSKNPNSKFLFIEQKTETDFGLKISHKSVDQFWINFNSFDKNNGVKYINDVDDFIAKIVYSGLNNEIIN